MRKKITSARSLVIAAVVFVAAACGDDNSVVTPTTVDPVESTTAAPRPAATQPPDTVEVTAPEPPSTEVPAPTPTTAAANVTDANADTLRSDPAAAESCAELAAIAMGPLQAVLDVMRGASADELFPPPDEEPIPALRAALDDYSSALIAVDTRMGELPDCDRDKFETIVCQQRATLEIDGTEAQEFLDNNFPPCE